MRGPDFSVHNFKCPDCELNCQLIQDGRKASMRHQLPACKTYLATKKDGAKFLELAFIAVPIDNPDPVLVAFRDSGQSVVQQDGPTLDPFASVVPRPDIVAQLNVSEPSAEHAAALAAARPQVLDPSAERAAELAAASPRVRDAAHAKPCDCFCHERRGVMHAVSCCHGSDASPPAVEGCTPRGWVRPTVPPRTLSPNAEQTDSPKVTDSRASTMPQARAARIPNPPRWQPLLEQLASELRAQIYDRAEVSRQLAQALIEAQPGATLVGFDDTRIAGIAQAIVAVCAASKGHP